MFDVGKIVTAIGVGAGDEVAIYFDQKNGWVKPFQNATDLYRVGATLGGYGLQAFMPRYAKLGDTLATASTPLLTKSVISVVRAQMGTTGRFVSKRRVSSGALVSQVTKPEFEGERSY